MFTSKQRSKLKSLGANLEPVMQVGKDGISDNLLKSLSEALEARELIKVTILETATEEPKSFALELASALNAEVVITMGRKTVLYRRSSKKDIEHIRF